MLGDDEIPLKIHENTREFCGIPCWFCVIFHISVQGCCRGWVECCRENPSLFQKQPAAVPSLWILRMRSRSDSPLTLSPLCLQSNRLTSLKFLHNMEGIKKMWLANIIFAVYNFMGWMLHPECCASFDSSIKNEYPEHIWIETCCHLENKLLCCTDNHRKYFAVWFLWFGSSL